MACRRFHLSIGILGSMVFFVLLSYRWVLFQDNKVERTRQQQELRKQLLSDLCDVDKEAFNKGRHSLEDMKVTELKNFIVDDTHGIIYCFIPKVACTNWKKFMFALKSTPYPDLASIRPNLVHVMSQFTLLSSFPKAKIKAKLKDYKKFLFVRDPFVRLISAYRDKFQRHNEYFYVNYGRYILQRYGNLSNPPQSADKAFKSNVRPSFYNFIQYLLNPETEKKEPFEPHWRQMYRLCHPCAIKYDFVGHQETFQEDAEELLKMLEVDNIKLLPAYANATTDNFVEEWFSTVPLEDRRKLYKLYEGDFRLFGYRKPTVLLDD